MSNNEMLEVLVDRSQGTTKIAEDQLEIMVHRRLFKVRDSNTYPKKWIGHKLIIFQRFFSNKIDIQILKIGNYVNVTRHEFIWPS